MVEESAVSGTREYVEVTAAVAGAAEGCLGFEAEADGDVDVFGDGLAIAQGGFVSVLLNGAYGGGAK